jgi:predicted transcriptional regulator
VAPNDLSVPASQRLDDLASAAGDTRPAAVAPPANAQELLQQITRDYDSLPRQLKRIASYMTQQSERIMVDRISDIARECEVHPSAIVRFSQRFGFTGFSGMQALFRQAYTQKTTPVLAFFDLLSISVRMRCW